MHVGWSALAVLTLGALAPLGNADETKKTDPSKGPVEALLKANKKTYTLDLGGKSAADFRKQIESGADTGEYPEAPKVDLTLELKNTSDKEVEIKVGGTQNVIELEVKGKGAITAPLKRRITPKFLIAPRTVTLAPGKSVRVPITSLEFGFKGSHRAWWVEPGKYTLSARYKTNISPRPKDAKEDGAVTLTSAPITLEVEGK
jgi:hypothetical protein